MHVPVIVMATDIVRTDSQEATVFVSTTIFLESCVIATAVMMVTILGATVEVHAVSLVAAAMVGCGLLYIFITKNIWAHPTT